ncbi:DUF6261 family protein [Aquimarina sediminis]|uniref:DUF6261 family protein n=1 Tax=Aquimarina sediminis TaxID=2070536 RepID=UPI000CA04443|nr:DUF6261 family protein [Aquimarina sediminis]
MIEKIDLSKLRNDEYIQFIVDTTKTIRKENAVVELVNKKLTTLEKQKEYLESVFKKQLGSDTTGEIRELDRQRDFSIIGIKKVIEGYTYHYDPEVKLRAILLSDSISKYDSLIYDQNYQAETTTIRNLKNDWETDISLGKALQQLHLSDWAEQLDAVNNDFNNKYLERNTELSKASEETVTSLRKDADKDYKVLISHISSHAILNPTQELTNIVNQINTLIEQYKILIEGRTKKDTTTDSSTAY